MEKILTTLVLGASAHMERYSYKAVVFLRDHHHPVWAVGRKSGQIQDVPIVTAISPDWSIDTVTLYLNPMLQQAYYDSILALRPRRIIFNPGTENPVFEEKARLAGIETQEACTLVLLQTQQYDRC
ncbi:MAG: CoA-binding protein [Sphingomonadales bacterium]